MLRRIPMSIPEYRILKNGNGKYKVQRKEWIFWRDITFYCMADDMMRMTYKPIIFETESEAKCYADLERFNALEKLNAATWEVL